MMKKPLIAALGGAGLLAASIGANATPFVVDLFSTDQAFLTIEAGLNGVNAGTTDFSQVGSPADLTILGGYRDLFLQLVSVDTGTASVNRTAIGVETNVLSFNNDSGIEGFAEIVWDGAAEYAGGGAYDFTGLGGFDLTFGGQSNSFVVETISADANWFFEVAAFTDADNWTRITFAATEVPSGTGPVTTLIPFDAFTNAANCGTNVLFPVTCAAGDQVVDLTNLGALVIRLNTGPTGAIGGGSFDIDLRLASIETNRVPEPATLSLVGLGLLATGFFGSRRRKSSAA